jgi:hypothetical protein
MLQLSAEFFGQSDEKFGCCALQFSPSKIKILGLFALKLGQIRSQKFWPLHLLSALFCVMQPNFWLDGDQCRIKTGSVGYSATETTTFVTTIFGK